MSTAKRGSFMTSNLFTAAGHLKEFVFYPGAWGGTDYWLDGWDGLNRETILNHLRKCIICREAEINAMLAYIAKPFRIIHRETICLDPVKHHEKSFMETLNFFQDLPMLLDKLLGLLSSAEAKELEGASLPSFLTQKLQQLFVENGRGK
jgi:hypothetical protein